MLFVALALAAEPPPRPLEVGVAISAIPNRRVTSDGSIGMTGAWHPAQAVALRVDADLAAYDPGRYSSPSVQFTAVPTFTPVDLRATRMHWAAIGSVELAPIHGTIGANADHPATFDLAASVGAGVLETRGQKAYYPEWEATSHPAALQLGLTAIGSVRPGSQIRLGVQHLSWVQRFSDSSQSDRRGAVLVKLGVVLR